MRKELVELKSYLCTLLAEENLANYEIQECKRILQGIDILLLNKKEERHNDLNSQDYFNGITLRTRVLFKNKRDKYVKTLLKLVDKVLKCSEVL